MIFVTVGTTGFVFQHLMDALTPLPAHELVVQHGPATPPPGVAFAAPFLTFPEMLDYFSRADVVITHAGVGSVLCALNAGQTPVVVPRSAARREVVDEHQTAFVRQLERDGKVIGVWDTRDLAEAVARAPRRHHPALRQPGRLHAAIRESLAHARCGLLAAPGSEAAYVAQLLLQA